MKLQTKTFPIQFKASADGVVEGYASVYSVIDSDNESFDPYAFKDSLMETGGRAPMLLYHDPTRPIALGEFWETDTALKVRFTPLLELPDGHIAKTLIENKVATGLSVGFVTVTDTFRQGRRVITKARLFETSVVLWPSNPQARITSRAEDLDGLYKQVEQINRELTGGNTEDLAQLLTRVRKMRQALTT